MFVYAFTLLGFLDVAILQKGKVDISVKPTLRQVRHLLTAWIVALHVLLEMGVLPPPPTHSSWSSSDKRQVKLKALTQVSAFFEDELHDM